MEPGEYTLVSRTHALSDDDLFRVLEQGVAALKEQRPLSLDCIKKVENRELLLFNHFSLSHEGNSLSLSEMRMLTELLASGKDWKRLIEEAELMANLQEFSQTTTSKQDVREASNHILVTEQLAELSCQDISETLILQLHFSIMNGLLDRSEEGLAGEYRKVAIGVEGSAKGRPSSTEIPPLMKRFFEVTMVQTNDECLIEYMARIHTEFQYIHPFRDGNGRIGRLIMNLHLMKNGYPVLVLPTTLSCLFNHSVELGHRGDRKLFARLVGEAIFRSLATYEDVLEGKVRLLPTVEDVWRLKLVDEGQRKALA